MPKNDDDKKKNDKEAKRKEEKSKEKQREKAEKAFWVAKNKELKRLRTDIKKSCSKVFKRKWRKKSEFECELDKDIDELQTCIKVAKDEAIKEKKNTLQNVDGEKTTSCASAGEPSQRTSDYEASNYHRQTHTSEAWSKDTDVNPKSFLHMDDKQEWRTTQHASADKYAQRERKQASEPEPDYMDPSEETPTNSRQSGDVEIRGKDKDFVDGTPNEKLDVITDTQQRKHDENIERVNKIRIEELQQEVERLTKKNGSLVQEKNTLQRNFEMSHKELKQKYEELKKECKEMYDQREEVRRAKEHEKHALNKKIAALQTEVESLDGEVKRLTHEKNDALTRLSELAGRRLVENNPAIADLSTEIRPTKIGENFMQVYDNEWTDAFEELQKRGIDDDRCISVLLSITKENFDLATTLAKKFREHIFSGLSNFPEEHQNVVMEKNNNPQVATKDEEQLINQLQRVSAARTVRSIQKYVKREREQTKYGKDCERFAAKCLEMCWYMAVQSPPLALIFDVKRLDPFNDKYFKKFVTTGDKFDFVVWPCILLHKNGPILAKGVAQAMKADSTKENSSDQVVKKESSVSSNANSNQTLPDKKEADLHDIPQEIPQLRQGNAKWPQQPKAQSYHEGGKTDQKPKNFVRTIHCKSTHI